MNRKLPFLLSRSLMLLITSVLISCSANDDVSVDETTDNSNTESTDDSTTPVDVNPDVNGDGVLNILVLGTNTSYNGSDGFSPDVISTELKSILSAESSISMDINVVAEDIHMSKDVTIGLGGGGTNYTYKHHSHSLTQYYYWPEGKDARIENLKGNGDYDWDYVVIGADPHIVATTPGFYSLGVNKIAATAVEGGAKALLLLMWRESESSVGTVEHFEEFTYRTSEGAKVELKTIPAGIAWNGLESGKKDSGSSHPSPNGAYLTAASIYSHIFGKSAATTDYTYDDELAEVALTTVNAEKDATHYSGERTFESPFKACGVTGDVISYNHTGSSSENGILGGLNWIFDQASETLQNGGATPITFNYGRANTNFEASKRYKIDPTNFDFSFGFPMQDHGNTGDNSMLYGIDRRDSGVENDIDLGVAKYMIENSELPQGRAIPIRTLFAQMKDVSPSISAYRDAWHMSYDLDKAVGAYMYTMLTGKCVLGDEPATVDSDEWRTWSAQKIGYETAWNVMHLEGIAPGCE